MDNDTRTRWYNYYMRNVEARRARNPAITEGVLRFGMQSDYGTSHASCVLINDVIAASYAARPLVPAAAQVVTDIERLTQVKDLLRDEDSGPNGCKLVRLALHETESIVLQFRGWSINLRADGTWIWTATDGG